MSDWHKLTHCGIALMEMPNSHYYCYGIDYIAHTMYINCSFGTVILFSEAVHGVILKIRTCLHN
jgi:hypothetical protein